jgi:drug/metabolite transporter (DMT)-like permease
MVPSEPAVTLRADARSWALVGMLTTIWGSSFFLIAVALRGFDPLPLAAGRVGFAALALGLALVAAGVRLPSDRRSWGWCGGLGVVGLALPFTLLAVGQQHVPSGVAAICVASVPLLVLALSRLVFGDPVGPRRWAGFAIGLAGIGWLAGPEAVAGLAGGGLLGLAACLGASACYACGAMIVRAMPAIAPLPATAAAHIVAAAVLLPFGLGDLPATWPAAAPVAALVALGVVQTGLAQVLRYVAIKRAGPVFVSLVGYLIPIWAGVLGVALLGEAVSLQNVAAYGLILSGILIARTGDRSR